MYIYQYIFIIIFFSLIFSGAVRYAALVFLLSFSIYTPFILPLDGEYYYAACGLLELSKGCTLNKRYVAVSYLCYLLIVINFLGWCMYEAFMDPLLYDIICAFIISLQIIILIIRPCINGINKRINSHFLVRLVDFDSGQTRVTMCKRQKKNEAHK